ncbi:hypothetical protein EG349_17615 [Chryseobacterium shandongense]|uniref:Uncharacterized protein n=1 Tax=Chryseobacterium shandongense TaxID=1493872 RepID=A0AAD1DNP8_9FLAO|nr:hypothetical protein [Chryseobacterium shandongense]AZA88460.1 hypothetical protein EG349_17615 [Chryseobacterium shandongense]AZA97004.1 hypothetical protein EG353_16315 [Chryseobacterium shandongense]
MVSKKLLIINIVVVMLLITAHTLGSCFIMYPMKSDIWTVISESSPYYLLIALAIFALIAWLISHLRIKNLNPKNKFLLAYTILCGVLLTFIIYFDAATYISTRKAIRESENEYIHQAKEDIKKDNVMYRFAGGLSIPKYDLKTRNKIDSIRKKFGVTYFNTGCTVDIIDIEGQQKYEEAVKLYLEKRNGKGWEEKMNREIENLKKVKLPRPYSR